MTDPAIIEAAARALYEHKQSVAYKSPSWAEIRIRFPDYYDDIAKPIIAAVTPMIEAAALEKAAKVAEDCTADSRDGAYIAARIRALKQETGSE